MKLLSVLLLLLLLTPVHAAQRFEDINQPVAEINIGVEITSLAMNSHRVAAVSTISGVRLYNADLLMLTEFRTDKAIRGVAWNPDGTELAVTVDNTVEIWNWEASTNTVTLERTLAASNSLVNVTWSPDGERIAGMTVADLGYDDNQLSIIDVWNTTTWSRFSYPDQYLVFALQPQSQVLTWNLINPSQMIGVGFRARFENGQVFYGTNKVIFITDPDTGAVIKDIEIGNNAVLAAAWQPNGNLIATASEVGGVGIYDSTTGERVAIHGTSSEFIRALDWSPYNGLTAAGNVVIDPVAGTIFGTYDVSGYVMGVEWLEDEDEYQGLLMMAERGGRITIQTIDVLPNYMTPTPTATPSPVSESDQLRALFSGDNCQIPCFLGIEPGVTTKSELEAKFLADNTTYIFDEWDEPDKGVLNWTPTPYPFLTTNLGIVASIEEEVVIYVSAQLSAPVSTVQEVFGAPDRVVHNEPLIYLIYTNEGLVFQVHEVGDPTTTEFVFSSKPTNENSIVRNPKGNPVTQYCPIFGVAGCIAPTATPTNSP